LKYLFRARRERDVSRRLRLTWTYDLRYPLPDDAVTQPERPQSLGGQPFFLAHQAEQQVLGADVVVLQQPGFFLSQDYDAAGTVSKPLEPLRPRSLNGRRCSIARIDPARIGAARPSFRTSAPDPVDHDPGGGKHDRRDGQLNL